MAENTLGGLVYQFARRDVFQGKGRIIISDFKKTIGQPHLTPEQIIEAFKSLYPQYEVDSRPESNVILFNFGK